MATRRRPRIRPEIEEAIAELVRRERTAAEIQRELGGRDDIDPDAVPDIRTIQRRIKERRAPDDSGRWTLADSDPNDVRVILDTLAEVTPSTHGRISSFSQTQASWIARVHRAAPDLPASAVFSIATSYIARVAKHESTNDLDAYLAFTPWRGEWWSGRYISALRKGWIPGSPAIVAAGSPDALLESIDRDYQSRGLWRDREEMTVGEMEDWKKRRSGSMTRAEEIAFDEADSERDRLSRETKSFKFFM